MTSPSLSSLTGQPLRCWCGNARLEDFSPDYCRCEECETLVLREMRGEEISRITDDETDFYGKGYYLGHVQRDYGLPDLETRARTDLPERCLHWLRTLLKFIPGPGARTLELGCGHGGFVAMQRWAGLDATGLELSPWLVDRARDWFGVPVLAGRLEDQDLPAASFDAVALMDVLEHLPNPRQTIGRAASLLRSPGGFLLIQTPCYPAGVTHEALLAQNHPFLIQLKPMEHLYLFSERAVARLCAEVGVGQVRFEPAIFAHYDLFAVASAGELRERTPAERTEGLMAASPPARWTRALLDLAETRDDLSARLAAADADGAALRLTAQTQDAEITRLHATAGALWPKIDAAVNDRNLLAAQLADLQGHFERIEAEAAARLRVIEAQGDELGQSKAQLSLAESELAELRAHHERNEADRAARLAVIQDQGAVIAALHASGHEQLGDLARLVGELTGSQEAQNALGEQLGSLRAQLAMLETERDRLASDSHAAQAACDTLRPRLATAEAEHAQLTHDLAHSRTERAGLATELENARARLHALESRWTGRLMKRFGLWPR